jgi:hypothetical protein
MLGNLMPFHLIYSAELFTDTAETTGEVEAKAITMARRRERATRAIILLETRKCAVNLGYACLCAPLLGSPKHSDRLLLVSTFESMSIE